MILKMLNYIAVRDPKITSYFTYSNHLNVQWRGYCTMFIYMLCIVAHKIVVYIVTVIHLWTWFWCHAYMYVHFLIFSWACFETWTVCACNANVQWIYGHQLLLMCMYLLSNDFSHNQSIYWFQKKKW